MSFYRRFITEVFNQKARNAKCEVKKKITVIFSSFPFFFFILSLQAGQATEPEGLVAVGLAAGNDGQVRHVACLNSFLRSEYSKKYRK